MTRTALAGSPAGAASCCARAAFEALVRDPGYGACWIAWDGTTPIGQAVLALRYTLEHGGLSGYVDDLFVRLTSRRRGIGEKLLEPTRDGRILLSNVRTRVGLQMASDRAKLNAR